MNTYAGLPYDRRPVAEKSDQQNRFDCTYINTYINTYTDMIRSNSSVAGAVDNESSDSPQFIKVQDRTSTTAILSRT